MNPVIKSLIERKSCRSFDDQHVSQDLIEQVIQAGLNAPSGMNRQPQIFVVVSKDEIVKQLSDMNAAIGGFSNDPFYGAKDVIVVLTRKTPTHIYDGSLAMGNLLNAAYSIGLGSIWIHRAKEVFESDEGKKLLSNWGITEDVEGIGFCALGYTKEEKAKNEIFPHRVIYCK